MTHIAFLMNPRNVEALVRARILGGRLEAASAEDEALLQSVLEAEPPSRPSPATWSLGPPRFFVHACDCCGASWLRPGTCCGERTRRTRIDYYLSSTSAPEGRRQKAEGSPDTPDRLPSAFCLLPSGREPPEFSVVMLTKNNLRLTQQAVESLRQGRGDHSIEFIFVDCCSTDGSLNYFRDLARKEAVQLIVTHPEEPFIYSRNCNRGAQVARGRFLLFANNDIRARDTELFPKLARALSDPRAGVVGTLTDKNRANELQIQPGLPEERVWSVKPVMGFLWGVRAEVFAELGGMDERFCDYGCDEIDFQYRAIHRNYRIALVDSRVDHELLATFGPNILPSLVRNMARFDEKHGCRLFDNNEWYWPFLAHPYPRISVAIACRNHGATVRRALDSALGSELPADTALQVVVVNDASDDDTARVLEEYRHQYPAQVNVLHRAVSRGPAAAKNAAIARCIGDTIALLDADDEFLPAKLSRSLETLEATGADFLYHDFLWMLPDGREHPDAIGEWSLKRWRNGRNLPTCAWVFRTGTVQFSERHVTGEDPEFLKRRWATLKTTYLPEALARYYVHPGSLSWQPMSQVVTGQLKGLASAVVP